MLGLPYFSNLKLMKQLVFCLAVFTSFSQTAFAYGSLKAHSVKIDVRLEPDGVMSVKTVARFDLNQSLPRWRWEWQMPFVYIDDDGQERRIPMNINSMMLDGEEMDYQKSKDFFVQVFKSPEEEMRLLRGAHTIKVEYETDRHIYEYAHHQELYCEMIGATWFMGIDTLTIDVRLPKGTEVLGYSGHCGGEYSGSQCRQFAKQITPKHFRFGTRHVGRTSLAHAIEIRFPKGEFPARNTDFSVAHFALDNGTPFSLFAFSLLVFVYFMWAWNKKGMGPDPKRLGIKNRSPKNLGPGTLAYLEFSDHMPPAALGSVLQLADKGAISIKYYDGIVVLQETENEVKGLDWPERTMLKVLFSHTDHVKLDPETYNIWFHRAISAYKKAIEGEVSERQYFSGNVNYWTPGFVLSLVGLVVSALYLVDRQFIPVFVCLGIAAGVFSYMVFNLFLIKANKGMAVSVFAAFIFFLGGVALFSLAASAVVGWPLAIGLIVLMGQSGLFYRMMFAHTKKGRAILDHLDAYKDFLKDGWSSGTRPREDFSLHLPFAAALMIEKDWMKQFGSSTLDNSESLDWYEDDMSSKFGHFKGKRGRKFLSYLAKAIIQSSNSRSRGGGNFRKWGSNRY